ncbi:MAG: 50S ribosomal protein L11 methyltransferase [Desulfobacteraceae bacterium]|nr:50S ribosomal protein L11 methyltransferase [Desulfobacteraceae bacterium]
MKLAEEVAGILASLSGTGAETIPVPSGGELVVAYLADDGEIQVKRALLEEYLQNLTDAAGQPLPVQTERLLEEDWGQSWKTHFKPARLTSRLAITPSWETYVPQGEEAVIELDPGMAFGTGLHASTRLALELIDETLASPRNGPIRALDVGTGTGILAMACALLGASRVVAIDNDPDAVHAAAENVRRNHLESSIEVSGRDLREVAGPFELVVANIIHDTLVELAPVLRGLVAPGGALILAGILQGEQEASIIATYRVLGLESHRILHREEWTALRFTAPF